MTVSRPRGPAGQDHTSAPDRRAGPHRAAGAASVLACVLLALASLAGSAAAQSSELVVTQSADSVAVAEVFELSVEVPVPAGSIVFFPDTLPGTPDVESFEPVEWRASRGPDDGATLTLTYALMPFASGTVTLPRLDVITVPMEDDSDGEGIPGGSLVGAWSDAPRPGRYTRSVRDRTVWVQPVFTSQDIVDGLSPRPPEDVIGLSWSLPSIALIVLFSTVIVGAVVTTTRGWLADRPQHRPAPASGSTSIDEARRQVMAELVRLLANGPYPPDRAFALYGETDRLLRDYVLRLHPLWGAELTSTELMGRLDATGRATPELLVEMRRAEAVKFGRLRPDATTTERHLRTLGTWLDADPGRSVERAGGRRSTGAAGGGPPTDADRSVEARS